MTKERERVMGKAERFVFESENLAENFGQEQRDWTLVLTKSELDYILQCVETCQAISKFVSYTENDHARRELTPQGLLSRVVMAP